MTNDDSYPQYIDDTLSCGTDDNDYWVLIDEYGNYFNPGNATTNGTIYGLNEYHPNMSYIETSDDEDGTQFEYSKPPHTLCMPGTPCVFMWRPSYLGPANGSLKNHFMIKYP